MPKQIANFNYKGLKISVENINNSLIKNNTKSTEGVGGIILGVIAAILATGYIVDATDKAKKDKIIKNLELYIEEITQELHKMYNEYLKAFQIFKKYDIITKLKKEYDIEKIINFATAPLTENAFVKELLKGVATDIYNIKKKKKPLNTYYLELLHIIFDDSKLYNNNLAKDANYREEELRYFTKCREMFGELSKMINNSSDKIKFDYDLFDELHFSSSFVIKYKLSEELIKKIISANTKNNIGK
jgi:hypothetical protein